MDAKEKAKELVKKYKGFSCNTCFGTKSDLITAKQCALIALDMIFTHNTDEAKHDYWIEVKEEIEKL